MGYAQLKSKAQEELIGRTRQDGSVDSEGDISAIVDFVEAYAWANRDHEHVFDARQHAIWRLFQELAPTTNDSQWDAVRARTTGILEGAGCWVRHGGVRGQQWTIRKRRFPGEDQTSVEPTCLRRDADGDCVDGMDDPRFCSRCNTTR